MAKKKKRGRRQGLFSKVLNVGLIALSFSRVIAILLDPRRGSLENKLRIIQRDATFGLSEGKFDLSAGVKMYAPVGAAVALGKVKSYAMRHFPVR